VSRPSSERSLARASVYRLLSLAFSWPSPALFDAVEPARVGASVLSRPIRRTMEQAAAALASRPLDELQAEHRRVFTLSASSDCPLNECAYSTKHVFQEMQELADIAGFYRAFGVEVRGQRPDELAAELEFCSLLSLKDAYARERRLRKLRLASEDALRTFLHDHLGRWAENIGRRLSVLAVGTAYERLGSLLSEFVAAEVDYLSAGPIVPHEETPRPPEPLEEEGCLTEAGPVASRVSEDDMIAELMPVEMAKGRA